MIIIIIRAFLLYFLVMFVLRFMGKKQLGELQPSELVTTIIISNIATISLEDPNLPMIAGVIPILLIVVLDVSLSIVTMRKVTIRKIFSGTSRYIVLDGVINQAEMQNLRYTIDDLYEAMHAQGIFDFSDVAFAVVETTGKLNFLTKASASAPAAVVKDGIIDESEVKRVNMEEKDVRRILFDNNISLKDVFLLTAENPESYSIIPKEYPAKMF